jgi:hypothetical protein
MKSMASGATMQRLGPSLRSLRENLTCFLDIRVYDRIFGPDALCAGNFNWGAAAFALGGPATVALLRSEPGLRPVAAGLTVSLLSVFALVELDPWYARFVLFFPLLTSLALARMWELHRGAAGLTLVALAMAFFATCLPAGLPRDKATAMAAQGWRSRAAFPSPAETDEPLAYLSEGFNTAYSLYGPDFSHRVVALRGTTIEELLRDAERERLTLIYVDGATRNHQPMLEEGRRRGLLEPFERDGRKGYVLRFGR